jgi:hypothetical protein
MSLFRRLFKSTQPTEEDTKYIFHFQKLIAFQQLFVEHYNDALAMVAGLGTIQNEAFSRPTGSVDNPEAVEKYIIPTLQEKIEILDLMESEHNEIGEPQSETLSVIYHNFTKGIQLMKKRANLQYDGFNAFVNDEPIDIDITGLDNAELEAMDKAIFGVTDSLKKLGFDGEDFIKINWKAFNIVRATIGLSELSTDEFQNTYFAGILGQPARFFTPE